jgi:hypothetical protein
MAEQELEDFVLPIKTIFPHFANILFSEIILHIFWCSKSNGAIAHVTYFNPPLP